MTQPKVLFALLLVIAVGAVGGCHKSSQCVAGQSGCGCMAGMCESGLACMNNQCQGEERVDLTISDKAARACEVLLLEKAGTIGSVGFASAVTGKWIRQGDKVSTAFVANGDSSIGAGAVHVGVAGADPKAVFEIVKTHCYDKQGAELASATVSKR